MSRQCLINYCTRQSQAGSAYCQDHHTAVEASRKKEAVTNDMRRRYPLSRKQPTMMTGPDLDEMKSAAKIAGITAGGLMPPPVLSRDDQLRMAALQAAVVIATPLAATFIAEHMRKNKPWDGADDEIQKGVLEFANGFYRDWLNKPPSATGYNRDLAPR